MADSVTIKLEGFKELEAELRALGPKVAANGLRSSNFAGTKIVLVAAKAIMGSGTAPKVITGTLQKNIRAYRRRTPGAYMVTHSVGIRSITRRNKSTGVKTIENPAFYGRLLEMGTSKMSAHPWLRPAFLANVDNAVNGIKGGLVKAIARATAKAKLK